MATDQEISDDVIFMAQNDNAGELILVRHGEQVWPNKLAPINDWVDPPLSPFGQQQAKAVGVYLASDDVDAVYSSSLDRAKTTAASIARHHSLEVPAFGDIDEIRMFSELPQDVSAVEALGLSEFAKMHLEFGRTQKWDSYLHGEQSAAFRSRVTTTIDAIIERHQESTVIVVSHGGVINAYLSEKLKLEPDNFFRPKHCSVSRIRFTGTNIVIDTLHEYRFLESQGLTNSGRPPED